VAVLDAQDGGGVLAEAGVGHRHHHGLGHRAGIASSSSSTSRALMFSPPRMITSALRSVMVR